MRKLFTRAGLAYLGAVLLAITACSTESSAPPETSTTPPTSVASTGLPSPTPAPAETLTAETVRPEINIPEPKKYPEMANDDLDGADAAARYFLDLYGYVYNTGDLKAWKALSDIDCEKCNVVAERVENYYSKGQWFENFSMLHGDGLVYYPTADQPFYLVTLEVVSTSYEHYDRDGSLITSNDEQTFPEYGIGVQYIAPNEWKVIGAATSGAEDAQDPTEPDGNTPAPMSPAEFNTIKATEFTRLHVTGSGPDFQSQKMASSASTSS